ncbi:Peptidase [Planifilum fulgidum]|uniref:Peptidase n=1 Tax=Planifilum fulgidum TaxID=201973 RepID=A0A1I2LJ98_9BACL|nr:hypothetical protein [Planifilum fulgidum]SFF78530.1 Peptidase [Planifilum fulgidum]
MMSNGKPIRGLIPLVLFLAGLLLPALPINVPAAARPVMYEGSEWLEGWRFRDSAKLETERFILHYPPSMKGKAEAILREAERVASDFERMFGFRLKKPVPVYLFPDRKTMQKRFSWPPDQSATGVYYAGGIYLLDPEEWMGEPLDPRREKWRRRFHEEGPLYHEFAHLYLDAATRGNVPRWYNEAFAQWVEYRAVGYEWRVPENDLDRNPIYGYPDLRDRFDLLPNKAMAYRQSFLFFSHQLDERGWKAMRRLHRELARGRSFEKAWKRAFDESVEQSFHKWQQATITARFR